jgi:uncharacterized protein YggT (Ycf19 family)
VALFKNVLNGLRLLILADALLSWSLAPEQFPRSLTKPLFDPFYGPLRKLLSPITGSVDLSPLIALIALYVLQVGVERAFRNEGG